MRKQKGDKSAFINGRKGSFGVKRPGFEFFMLASVVDHLGNLMVPG